MTTTTTTAPTSTTPTSTTPTGTTDPKTPVQTSTTAKDGTKTDPKTPVTQQTAPGDDSSLVTGDDAEGTDGSDATATEIEITVPDGVEVDNDLLTGFKGIAKTEKIPSKAAQKIFDFYVGSVQKAEESIKSAWDAQKTKWKEAATSDKEFGGASFKANMEIARKVIDKLGGPSLKKALKDLDVGNHPEIIRFAYRVGKALSEDSLSDVGGLPTQTSDAEAAFRKAFPSMYEKDEQ